MNGPRCNIVREDDVGVGKYGRTTAFTYGEINAIPVIIDPKSDGGVYTAFSESYGLTVKDCGCSMSFVAYEGSAVERGDCGSILMHTPSGDWLGLIFGESMANTALFTPIDLVLQDIEKVTGREVIEPVFRP